MSMSDFAMMRKIVKGKNKNSVIHYLWIITLLIKAEPTGVEFSVTNFLPLPYSFWGPVSKGAAPAG